MKGFTGKPKINRKSRSIKRGVDDLYSWKNQAERKREGEIQMKELQQQIEIQRMQSQRMMSKESKKYVA